MIEQVCRAGEPAELLYGFWSVLGPATRIVEFREVSICGTCLRFSANSRYKKDTQTQPDASEHRQQELFIAWTKESDDHSFLPMLLLADRKRIRTRRGREIIGKLAGFLEEAGESCRVDGMEAR